MFLQYDSLVWVILLVYAVDYVAILWFRIFWTICTQNKGNFLTKDFASFHKLWRKGCDRWQQTRLQQSKGATKHTENSWWWSASALRHNKRELLCVSHLLLGDGRLQAVNLHKAAVLQVTPCACEPLSGIPHGENLDSPNIDSSSF